MPIRAYCTICSDYFDNVRDVAAIHCGHTFHQDCLDKWFQSAPNRTCPGCRIQVSTRYIIRKLFFDNTEEGEAPLDAESLKNELDKTKAQLSSKEKEKRECQSIVDMLRETLDIRNATIASLQKELGDTDMLCSALKKQMKFLEKQQDETKAAKEEARRLRNKMKAMESLELLLQGQRTEVEEMVRDMGIGQSAVEQLSIYCVSLKKEYEKLKEVRKASGEMTEKLKRELFSTSNTLQKALSELDKTKEELRNSQKELRGADKEILSLKKKVEFLQKTLSTPTETNEAISRLVFESPAPLELQRPRLHRPADDEIDLDINFDIDTPEHLPPKSITAPAKKIKLDPVGTSAKSHPRNILQEIGGTKIRTGYDGMGGRTKFIQPTNLTEIRPLLLTLNKKKKVSRPTTNTASKDSTQPTMDIFLK
ncbi:E3 ubiquitin-protein ligase TRAIP isoform X2 [Ambystoma mexicanum]|uniref:E3 ubiquitin-protein ligase TRAIP isoform X2 n=1 Tax=Ambystoma mexicanum TaxID=8296 RepID=UPI0037E9B815